MTHIDGGKKRITRRGWGVSAPLAAGLIAAFFLLQGSNKSAVEYYREGRRALEKGDYRTAAHNFREAANVNPAYVRAHLGAGDAYFRMGEYARARDAYLRVLEREAKNLEALVGLGRVHTELDEFEAAESYLKKVSELEPGNIENNFARGLYYERLGKSALARGYYKKVERANPAHIGALLRLAGIEAKIGRYDLADNYLQQARRIDPYSALMQRMVGETKLSEALDPTATRERAERKARLEEAYQAFATAQSSAPDDLDLQERLAVIELYRNDVRAALDRVRSLLARRGRGSAREYELQYLVGVLYRIEASRAGNEALVRRSLEFTREALRLEPLDSISRFSIEEAVLDNRRLFPTGGELRRMFAEYHFERARYYRSRSRLERATRHLRRALLLNPKHMRALEERLELARLDGDFETFLQLLIRLRDSDPGDARLQYRLERALMARDQSMAQRENLLAPEVAGKRATFERTPARVFIFDFEPEEKFPLHPDGAALIARGLNFQISEGGRLQPVSDEFRALVMDAIRKAREENQDTLFSFGSYYRPEYLGRIEDAESMGNRDMRSDLVVGGTYRSTRTGLRVKYRVYAKRSGRLLDEFELSARGPDAIYAISARAAARILQRVVASGRVVKVKSDELFLNIGSIDGVKQNERVLIYRPGRASAPSYSQLDGELINRYLVQGGAARVCVVTRVARYIAACRPEKRGSALYYPGDTVIALDGTAPDKDNKNDKDNAAGGGAGENVDAE